MWNSPKVLNGLIENTLVKYTCSQWQLHKKFVVTLLLNYRCSAEFLKVTDGLLYLQVHKIRSPHSCIREPCHYIISFFTGLGASSVNRLELTRSPVDI